jgi:hypothetical protein
VATADTLDSLRSLAVLSTTRAFWRPRLYRVRQGEGEQLVPFQLFRLIHHIYHVLHMQQWLYLNATYVLCAARDSRMIEKYKRTGIFIMDDELWNWAQYRAKQLGKESVSQYLFDLIREDKKKGKS